MLYCIMHWLYFPPSLVALLLTASYAILDEGLLDITLTEVKKPFRRERSRYV